MFVNKSAHICSLLRRNFNLRPHRNFATTKIRDNRLLNLCIRCEQHRSLFGSAAGTGTTSTTKPDEKQTVADSKHEDSKKWSLSSLLRRVGASGLVKRTVSKDEIFYDTAAIRLYSKCANGVDFLYFIEKFKLPNTLDSWFAITALHMWFVLLRLRQLPESEEYLRTEFCDVFVDLLWQDLEMRLDDMRHVDKFFTNAVKNKVKETSYAFLMLCMLELDEGIMRDDTALAASLWRVFSTIQKGDDIVALNDLVRYVRMQVHEICERDIQDILKNGITRWTTL